MLKCARLGVIYGLQYNKIYRSAQWQPGHAHSWWRLNTVKGMPTMSHGAQVDEEKHEPADLVDDHELPSSAEAYFDFP